MSSSNVDWVSGCMSYKVFNITDIRNIIFDYVPCVPENVKLIYTICGQKYWLRRLTRLTPAESNALKEALIRNICTSNFNSK